VKANAFTLFETAIGSCAIAWGPGGIVGSRLPDRDASALRARMAAQYPQAFETEPPAYVASAIEAICALLRGEACDLSGIALDMQGVKDFNRRVYQIARAIPPGTTLSYGDIAVQLGDVSLSRAVGQALGENPFPPIVPCHRVISADGRMHGFSSSGGVAMKLRMLAIEGWQAEQLSFFA
jgi:methylated-DNA-[protein]-cysteine S-methyltransferase